MSSFFGFKRTVDGVIADIIQKIEDLHIVHEIHNADAEVHSAIVTERSKLYTKAVADAQRAKAIAEKLTALVTP